MGACGLLTLCAMRATFSVTTTAKSFGKWSQLESRLTGARGPEKWMPRTPPDDLTCTPAISPEASFSRTFDRRSTGAKSAGRCLILVTMPSWRKLILRGLIISIFIHFQSTASGKMAARTGGFGRLIKIPQTEYSSEYRL